MAKPTTDKIVLDALADAISWQERLADLAPDNSARRMLALLRVRRYQEVLERRLRPRKSRHGVDVMVNSTTHGNEENRLP